MGLNWISNHKVLDHFEESPPEKRCYCIKSQVSYYVTVTINCSQGYRRSCALTKVEKIT